ncbi:HTH-type transcriptional activator IlvY [Sansalvadorimonas sp. 2012CJ34-2]|uniref:HTH-type transcriptional activator IlvY n=1 Tax=Parendozoicomonas callyspongiae TaxID=2942213 RepID=A0ABT0PK36_9GAMM|nr:HTH-type transcriptional activator IlvY [Sansalvadorimonas sp. 2012CJ34-2]MCL6271749.1 HTH-type transcriptional activator IlvY [Sansalvadorimonas sp. 2012CJ34-2]
MDFRTLKQFLTLADTLHFGRASEVCHISPPTLSRAIKSLEESLGVMLFERDNRQVSLTREGKRFQSYVREALSQWEAINHALISDSQELKGELSVYCSVTASYSFLYDILHNFRQQYPLVEIKLHTGDPDQAIGHVLSGAEDIAIAAHPDKLPANLAFRKIAVSPLVFIAPKTGFDIPASDEEWSQTPMILSEQGIARKRVNKWFVRKEIKPRIYAQVAGNEAIVSMVSLGFGIGVVPKIVLDNSPLASRIHILKVSDSLKAYDVGICAQEKKLKNPVLRALWEQINISGE